MSCTGNNPWNKRNGACINTINHFHTLDCILCGLVDLYNAANKPEHVANINGRPTDTVDGTTPPIRIAFQTNNFKICIHAMEEIKKKTSTG